MGWFARALNGGRRAPRDVDGAMRSALLAVLAGDLEEAERLLTAAVRLDSRDVQPYIALARVFRAQGELGRAIRLHQNLLLRADLSRDQTVDTLVDLAAALEAGGFVQRAIASFEEALGHDPKRVEALHALVGLYGRNGDHAKALATARRLARLDPIAAATEGEGSLRVRLAEAALADGQLDQARRALKQALRADRENVRGWIVLGRVEAERGRPKAALAAWSRVPSLDRLRGPEVYPQLAATYAALDRARDFESSLRRLIEEEPGDPHARLALARALAARGETDDAISALRELLGRHPDDLEARATLCRVMLTSGREAESAAEVAALIEAMERRGVLQESEKLA